MNLVACQPKVDWDSADMLALYFEEETGPWNERILDGLEEAASLLDCLQIWGIRECQLLTHSDGTFLVKWRE